VENPRRLQKLLANAIVGLAASIEALPRLKGEICMTKKLIIAVACVSGVAFPAAAETWRARIVTIPEKSVSSCTADVSKLWWDLTLEGATFSGKSSEGPTFSTTVAQDGMVKASYTGKFGAITFPAEMTGNVKTKQLEIQNIKYSCRYKVLPM
jgi:hypothetical protein